MSYPDCASCGDPVRYDAEPEYYRHEDTAELMHVDCYDEWTATAGVSDS